ncbi:MAG: purine-nucleoside phosphorylase [Candidatus Eiseniibacteriota bacterium]|nr:MAG: purine-nucleoside phosphorylase [Candidatus Eisenbacteria bacterium]
MQSWNEREEALTESVIRIRRECCATPSVGIILGSGFAPLVEEVDRGCTIPYASIPHFTAPTVEGHAGFLVLGSFGGITVALLQGRSHLYEGHSPEQVTFPVRVLPKLGVRSLIVTNASGSFDEKMRPGDLMLVEDHIDLTFRSPLRGQCGWKSEPVVRRAASLYDRHYMEVAERAAKEMGVTLRKGVLGTSTGPSYETAAESSFMRQIGAHTACMSTSHEVLVAQTLGLRVLGFSCISNLATGFGSGELSHEEVGEVVGKTAKRIGPFFKRLVREIDELRRKGINRT